MYSKIKQFFSNFMVLLQLILNVSLVIFKLKN